MSTVETDIPYISYEIKDGWVYRDGIKNGKHFDSLNISEGSIWSAKLTDIKALEDKYFKSFQRVMMRSQKNTQLLSRCVSQMKRNVFYGIAKFWMRDKNFYSVGPVKLEFNGTGLSWSWIDQDVYTVETESVSEMMADDMQMIVDLWCRLENQERRDWHLVSLYRSAFLRAFHKRDEYTKNYGGSNEKYLLKLNGRLYVFGNTGIEIGIIFSSWDSHSVTIDLDNPAVV